MTTETFKKRILREINNFMLNDDLIALAKAQIMIEEVLKSEDFAYKDYKNKLAPYPYQENDKSKV